jgi:predicted ATPase
MLANLAHEVPRYAEEMLDLGSQHGFPFASALGTRYLGFSSVAVGQATQGVSLLTQAISLLRATGTMIGTAGDLTSLAEAYGTLGQLTEGLRKLDEAAQVLETTDERFEEAMVYRVRGDLLNAAGDQEAAEQNYHRALAVAASQSSKAFELRSATSLARLWRDQGKQAEARDLLAPIYGWFTEGFDTPVLQEAKNLLDELRR